MHGYKKREASCTIVELHIGLDIQAKEKVLKFWICQKQGYNNRIEQYRKQKEGTMY